MTRPKKKRNYENFLDAYLTYARDNFVPDKFHFWTGISIVAAAMERKVSLPWSSKFSFYPNMYVLLVSRPGIGKSSAIVPGRELLRSIPGNQINFIPDQVTEAKLIEVMQNSTAFDTSKGVATQSAGYYSVSEASACLKDIYGDFINLITAFYDCDEYFSKATVRMGSDPLRLQNVCFNLLAGSTFSYLGKLLAGDNIMGGFASRLTYVIQSDAVERIPSFQGRTGEKKSEIELDKLREDLADIHSMVGEMKATSEFAELWERWFQQNDKYRQGLKSEKMQALLARKSTNALKMCMILSASEGSDYTMTGAHWKRALELIDEVEASLPDMLREGASQDIGTQKAINAGVMKLLLKADNWSLKESELVQELVLDGHNRMEVLNTLKTFEQENDLVKINKADGSVTLIGLANNYI